MSPIGLLFGRSNFAVKEREWAWIVALLWGSILLIGLGGNIIPTSTWLDVRSITVSDTTVGTAPTLEVDRRIGLPFVASWLVEVERHGRQGYFLECSAEGRSAYRPNAELPDPLTLDWWTAPTICNLPAGTYRVETTWTLDLGFAGTRFVRVLSNPFDVKAKS